MFVDSSPFVAFYFCIYLLSLASGTWLGIYVSVFINDLPRICFWTGMIDFLSRVFFVFVCSCGFCIHRIRCVSFAPHNRDRGHTFVSFPYSPAWGHVDHVGLFFPPCLASFCVFIVWLLCVFFVDCCCHDSFRCVLHLYLSHVGWNCFFAACGVARFVLLVTMLSLFVCSRFLRVLFEVSVWFVASFSLFFPQCFVCGCVRWNLCSFYFFVFEVKEGVVSQCLVGSFCVWLIVDVGWMSCVDDRVNVPPAPLAPLRVRRRKRQRARYVDVSFHLVSLPHVLFRIAPPPPLFFLSTELLSTFIFILFLWCVSFLPTSPFSPCFPFVMRLFFIAESPFRARVCVITSYFVFTIVCLTQTVFLCSRGNGGSLGGSSLSIDGCCFCLYVWLISSPGTRVLRCDECLAVVSVCRCSFWFVVAPLGVLLFI